MEEELVLSGTFPTMEFSFPHSYFLKKKSNLSKDLRKTTGQRIGIYPEIKSSLVAS